MKLPLASAVGNVILAGANGFDRQMRVFEKHFGGLAEKIQKRRKTDAELDEICRDFELLMTSRQYESSLEDVWNDAFNSSLAGLKKEILAKLEPD
ncbi:hypothetical protein [Ruegeria atlantica]|nr:hypothetical protein [Ruegeria atlantica]